MTYDMEKIRKIITNYENELERAIIGMEQDFYLTSEVVWEGGKYILDLDAGDFLTSSYWATPIIILELKDGEEIEMNAYK